MYELLTLLLSVCTGIAGYLLGRAAKLNGYEKRIKCLEEDKESLEKKLKELTYAVGSFLNKFCFYDGHFGLYHADTKTCLAFKDLAKSSGLNYFRYRSTTLEIFTNLLDEQIFKNKVRDEMRKHLSDDDDDVTESDVERVIKNIKE